MTNQKSSYVWNTIAGLINASEAVILLMVITRTNNTYDAGVLTLAFSVANLLVNIGKFGMRNYQVTDIAQEHSFNTYITARVLTVAAMVLASVVYVGGSIIYNGYSNDKAIVVFVMCLLYALEAFEDVFWGLYQQKGRLDVGAKIFSYRWIITLFVFVIALCISHNLVVSIIVSTIISAISLAVLLKITYHKVEHTQISFSFNGVLKLLWTCVPLFLAGFCSFYITNAPKYAIDKYLTEEFQAYYGFIAMPVFVIGLLNSFFYQPILVKMTLEWQEKKYNLFVKRIFKQSVNILILTLICMLGAFLVGIPVLSFLYHTDLSPYKSELLILLVGGGLLALSGFFCVIMTIMRIQNKMIYGYVGTSVVAAFTAGIFVKNGGLMGAAINYDIVMLILTIIFATILIKNIKNNENLS